MRIRSFMCNTYKFVVTSLRDKRRLQGSVCAGTVGYGVLPGTGTYLEAVRRTVPAVRAVTMAAVRCAFARFKMSPKYEIIATHLMRFSSCAKLVVFGPGSAPSDPLVGWGRDAQPLLFPSP